MVFVYLCAPWATRLQAPWFIPPEERGNAPTWNAKGGWLYCSLIQPTSRKRRRWVSYRGKRVEFYFGTKPSTGSGPIMTFRKANARGI